LAKEVIFEADLDGEVISAAELSQIPDFAGIRKESWERFRGAIVRKTFKAGQVLMRQGENGTTAFYILSGTIAIFIERPVPQDRARPPRTGLRSKLAHLGAYLKGVPPARWERPERTHIPIDGPVDLPMENPIAEVGAGDLLGELAALAILKQERIKRPKFYPRAATAQAVTDAVVLEMLPNILNNVLYTAPKFKETLNRKYRERALDTHLRSVPLFRSLTPEFLEELKQKAELQDVAPGQVICRQGDAADAFYLIRLGFVKVSKSLPGGELVLTYLSRGSYFGEMGLLPPMFRIRATGRKPGQATDGAVSAAPLTIGRNPGSADALAVPWDEYVSREHAEVRVDNGQVLVKRLPSGKNPIAVSGRPVNSARLSAGESFTIGETTFAILEDPLQAGRRTATYTAVDFVQLVRIKTSEFNRMLEQFPAIAETVMEVARARRQMDLAALGRVQQVSLGSFLEQDLMQGQNLLLLDLDRCTRCDECVKACAATHRDGFTRLVRDGLRFENFLVPTSCRACLDPLCMTRCPVGAIRRKQSLDIVIEDWCIGCGNCGIDCPYGNINIVEVMTGGQKPELRPFATVCDLCAEYPEPNCVRACPHDAALRVEPRAFFARDLAGIQLAVTPRENLAPPPTPAPLATETRLYSNGGELLAMLPQLKILDGPDEGSVLLLRFPSTSFGRGAGNDYRFPNDSIMSRSQAVIVCDQSKFILRDLNSANGTTVNNNLVSEVQLQPGDVIEMGAVRMEFLVGGSR
jgi:CRP-like cAMP-binding protein/Fe-S-cluster-containing hydrogenase component 2